MWAAGSVLAATPSDWIGGNGSYTDATRWSTGVAPVTSAYDARIATAGAIQLAGNATVNSLTLSDTNATLTHTSGVLQAGRLHLDAGTYRLDYATLKNTVITGGEHGGQFQFGLQTVRLDNVTFDTGSIGFAAGYGSDRAEVFNDLTVNSSFNIMSGRVFYFEDCSLLGSGEVVVNAKPSSSNSWASFVPSAGTFTVGPDMTIRTGVYNATSADAGSIELAGFTNRGTISCQTDKMRVRLDGEWHNAGKLRVSAGMMILAGQFGAGDIGDLLVTGGTVVISGAVDASAAPLRLNAATGSVLLNRSNLATNGSIRNGRIETADNTQLILGGGTQAGFENVTIAGAVQASTGADLRATTSLAFDNGTLSMISSTIADYPTLLDFMSTLR